MHDAKAGLPVLVWGSCGHALVVADILRSQGQVEIVGFIDDGPECAKRIGEVSVLGNRHELIKLNSDGIKHIIIGFGDCEARLRSADFAAEKGFDFITAIHPSAVIAGDASIGGGTVVAAASVINPAARIGRHVIINTSASVDHECLIDDGAHIGPGAHLGGCVTVGRATWIGIGAVVKDHVKIGAGTIIGAGAVVVEDIPDGVVAYGVPAKVQRRVSTDE
jgi:UDP-N-acetylbacillosamine N-acetyltransferase